MQSKHRIDVTKDPAKELQFLISEASFEPKLYAYIRKAYSIARRLDYIYSCYIIRSYMHMYLES